jgi:hypothetical protein
MPAGGLISPKDILYTYSQSKNSVERNEQSIQNQNMNLFSIQNQNNKKEEKNIEITQGTYSISIGLENKEQKVNTITNLHKNEYNRYFNTGKLKQQSLKKSKKNIENFEWPKNTGPNKSEKICLTNNFNNCDIPENKREDCIGPSGGDKDTCLSNENCCYKESDNAPWCYKRSIDNQCNSVICPNDIDNIDTCGSLDKNIYIDKRRPYDFFVGTTLGNGIDSGDFSSLWDKYLYCGCQKNDPYAKYLDNSNCAYFNDCKNYIEATEKPLSSLFLWDIFAINNASKTYNDNINQYTKLFIGKTGICNKLLDIDKYEDCSSDENSNNAFKNCGAKNMGLCHYISEKSVLNNLPFQTSFCLGNGNAFYINGIPQHYYGTWFDGIQDYLPTWRWWSKQQTTKNEDDKYIESTVLSIDYSKSYYGGSSLKIDSKIGMNNTDFYLFKTQFSTKQDIKLKITLCGDDNYNSKISIGYTLASDGNIIDNPPIYYFNIDKVTKNWNTKEFIIKSTQNTNYISSLCLKTISDNNSKYTINIGKISLDYIHNIKPKKPYITNIEYYTQTYSKLTNYNVYWNSDTNYDYYNIYYGMYFVGRVFGNKNKNDKSDLVFNLQNMKKSFNSFRVEGVAQNGDIISSYYSDNLSKNIHILLILITLLSFSLIFIFKNKSFVEKFKVISYILIFILIITTVLQSF